MPHVRASLPDDLSAWLDSLDENDDFATAWRRCPRADWLLRLAMAVDAERSLVVHAAADLVSEALSTLGAADLRAHRAVRTALSWIEGRAPASEAWAAGFSAMEAADDAELADRLSLAMRAAACVAFACDDRADAGFYAHRGYAARAGELATPLLSTPSAAADRVRARVPLAVFLAALDVASRPPPAIAPAAADGETSDSFYL